MPRAGRERLRAGAGGQASISTLKGPGRRPRPWNCARLYGTRELAHLQQGLQMQCLRKGVFQDR